MTALGYRKCDPWLECPKFNILDLDMNARNFKKWMSGQVNSQHFITSGVIKCAYDKEDFTFYQRDQFFKKDVEIQEQMR